MAKKIKADALASEVMKELDDYSSLTTEVMKKAVRNAGKQSGRRLRTQHRKRPELMEKAGRSKRPGKTVSPCR